MDREELPNPLSIVGDGQHKILVFDDFLVDPDEIIETASKLAPLFIANERDFYPGVRYKILGDNSDAAGYVKSVCDAIRPATVSYTHLDVYKRQTLTSCKLFL